MRVVVALGGNALLRRGEAMTADVQGRNVRRAAEAIAPLVRAGHSVAITHGNGPQIGLLALQNTDAGTSYPLDVLGAETDGMIGYLIERELAGLLPPEFLLAALLTQVRVDRHDPAFRHPTKPIGRTYAEAEARALADAHGWVVARDGKGWRRVVPSPAPTSLLEVRAIELLLRENVTVICCGGGGIPVVESDTGTFEGVEAVVDKDFVSALLARQIGADVLLLLTDVDAVYSDWGTDAATPRREIRLRDFDATHFASGSMRPKLEAATGFVAETGRQAAIGRLEDLSAVLAGERGTRIVA